MELHFIRSLRTGAHFFSCIDDKELIGFGCEEAAVSVVCFYLWRLHCSTTKMRFRPSWPVILLAATNSPWLLAHTNSRSIQLNKWRREVRSTSWTISFGIVSSGSSSVSAPAVPAVAPPVSRPVAPLTPQSRHLWLT